MSAVKLFIATYPQFRGFQGIEFYGDMYVWEYLSYRKCLPIRVSVKWGSTVVRYFSCSVVSTCLGVRCTCTLYMYILQSTAHNSSLMTLLTAENDDPLYLAQFLINPAKGQSVGGVSVTPLTLHGKGSS